MTVPLKSNTAAFMAKQAQRLSFETSFRLTRMKKLPSLANGLTSALQRNAFIDGKISKPLEGLKQVSDKIIEGAPGGNPAAKAGAIGGTLKALIAIGGAVAIVGLLEKFDEFIQDAQIKSVDALNADLTKVNELAVRANVKNKELEFKIGSINDANARADREIASAREVARKAELTASEARKLGNDALYEVRQGRVKQDAEITSAKKQANDALYETRQGRTILETQIKQQGQSFSTTIASLNTQIANLARNTSDGFQNAVNTTINRLQTEITSLRTQVNKPVPPPTPVDTAGILASAKATALNAVQPVQSQVNTLQGTVASHSSRLTGLETSNNILGNTITGLAGSISNVNNKADAALREAQIKGIPTQDLQKSLDDKFNAFVAQNNQLLGIQDLKRNDLAKEFDRRLADFTNLNNLNSEQRFNQFRQENNNKLGVQDLKISDLSKEFDKKFGEFVNLNNKTSQERFDTFTSANQNKLGLLQTEINTIDTKIKQQEKVNQEAIPKLDNLISLAGLIPARVNDTIKPNLITPQQVETAAGTAICKSLNGGCSGKANNDLQNAINNNTNQGNNNLLNQLNAGANASQLALLNTINTKLGAQIVGGISGKLVDGFKWLQLDRALNLLTFAATVHNAIQLSSDIGQTLGQAIGNVLTLIGIKDDKNQPLNVNQIIGNSVENIIKGLVGADNYTSLRESWAKANRIYQATTNVVNSFQNLASTILNALEITAGRVGKIGNALRQAGEVLENAYGWMSPQPKFNRVTQTLESLQAGASTIQMVTQAPLDVIQASTEMTNASTEFIKALKEDDKPANKSTPEPEPDVLKAEKAASKTVSAGKEMTEETLEPDED
ncbi:hypothetical protein IQ243_28010 [Nostocales cyanobacterium LEGE 11386]|nr:hypothetical protein [Nostocales cyanobacterium LEGE 11386]